MVLEFARPIETVIYEYYTPADRFTLMDSLSPPDNTIVWLGQQASQAPGCQSLHSNLATIRNDTEIQLGHVSTFWFGEFVIQVLAHLPNEIRIGNSVPLKPGPWNREALLVQIYLVHRDTFWPPAAMTKAALNALEVRFTHLEPPDHRPNRIGYLVSHNADLSYLGEVASSDMSEEALRIHRIISTSVRDMLDAYRIQAQAGRVNDKALEEIIFRAAHGVLQSLASYPGAQRVALLPSVVRILLTTFVEEMVGRDGSI